MPKRSTRIRGLKRSLNNRLAALRMTQAQAMRLYEKLYTIDWLITEIDETARRMILWGDEWSKDDYPHAPPRGCPRAGHEIGACLPGGCGV